MLKAANGLDRVSVRIAAVLSGGRADALLVGLLAFLVSVIGADRPSLWFDEAATIAGSTYSVPQMLAMLTNVDAVHGVYYLLMHAWFSVFPATEFWARLPSALLIGGAAAGLVVLGKALSNRAVAIAAGVVFTVLPRTTWAGIEARSYALSMFDAVWLTVLCVAAVRSRKLWLWGAYALALGLTALCNVFVLFLVAAHGAVVLGCGVSRQTLARFTGAVVAATIVLAPFIVLIQGQQKQVAWIAPVGPGTLGQILGDQYFPAVYSGGAHVAGEEITQAQIADALFAWALVLPIIIGIVVVAVAALRMRRRRTISPHPRLLLWTASVWVVVPTAVLVFLSVIGKPMYQPHYLSYTVPGLALLIGLAVVIVGREPRRIAGVLAVLALAALPNYLAQRGPYAKFGQDQSAVAALVDAEAAQGECLNIDLAAPESITGGLTAAHPAAFAGLRDHGVEPSEAVRLFESRKPISAWTDKLVTCPVLWTITERDETLPDHSQDTSLAAGPELEGRQAYQVPAMLGFQLVERWQLNLTQVVKSVRITDSARP